MFDAAVCFASIRCISCEADPGGVGCVFVIGLDMDSVLCPDLVSLDSLDDSDLDPF